jgi:hypothetical protein
MIKSGKIEVPMLTVPISTIETRYGRRDIDMFGTNSIVI